MPMVGSDYSTNFLEKLLGLLKSDGGVTNLLALLRFLLIQVMDLEVNQITNAQLYEHSQDREAKRSGYRDRRFDSSLGTLHLKIPKLRQGGYIPSFITPRMRSDAALITVVEEAAINGVSTRKMEKLLQSLGIESVSASQASKMTERLNEEAKNFRTRSLEEHSYPVLWVDALYERVRTGGKVVSMAVEIVCGVNEEGAREVIAIETMLTESESSYSLLFDSLIARGLSGVKLVISDAHPGLERAIRNKLVGASWQRCKVHFMRNVLAHVPNKEVSAFASELKAIWQAPTAAKARLVAQELAQTYEKRYPKAIAILLDGLENTLSYYAFPGLDSKRVSSTNMLERLNREARRRSSSVNVFPSQESYLKLMTMYLIEYSEDWGKYCYLNREAIQNLLSD